MPVLGEVAVQVTVAGWLPRVLSTITFTGVLPPGARRTCAGSVRTCARVLGGNRTGPAQKDGGASCAPVPHDLFGCAPTVKSSLVRPGRLGRVEVGVRGGLAVDAQALRERVRVTRAGRGDLDQPAVARVHGDLVEQWRAEHQHGHARRLRVDAHRGPYVPGGQCAEVVVARFAAGRRGVELAHDRAHRSPGFPTARQRCRRPRAYPGWARCPPIRWVRSGPR